MAPGLRVAQRFEIEHLVRSGRMGKLFQAHDRQTDKTVALRLFRLTGAKPRLQVDFEQTLERLAGLAPKDLAPLAYGQIETGEYYLATAWLEGEDLGQRLLHKPLRVAESLELMRSVSHTLALLHARGLVHGDLRPSRLFLRAGSIRNIALLGLGLPRVHLSARTLTRPGEIVSTLRYVAPELLRKDDPPGPQADIFALGCVLFECLTGVPLFGSTGVHAGAILTHVLYGEAPPLGELRPELPPTLGQLLGRMLARQASERMVHGGELVEALAAIDLLPEHAEMQPLPPPASALAGTEQRLVSLALALSPLASSSSVSSVRSAPSGGWMTPTAAAPQEAVLDRMRRAFDARIDVLADGSLLMTRAAEDAARQTATDQAVQMAHAARQLAETLPTWRIAVSMGRGVGAGFEAAGEALHRAVALLAEGDQEDQGRTQARTGTRTGEVWLDELTAELLDMRFQIHRPRPGRAILGEERQGTEEPRLLLGRPTPCVGREQELRLLSALVAGCTEEERARAVLVLGTSGIGKSRLRHELVRRLQTHGSAVTVIQGRGDALQTGMTHGLLSQAVCELCGLPATGDLAERRARLAAEIERRIPTGEGPQVAEFLGELCSLPFPDEASPQLRAARQDPRLMSDQVEAAFIALLGAECARQPVLLVLEDLHWSDEATVRLCEAALRECAERPLFVLGLGRPEVKERFPRLWEGCPVQELWLGALSRKAGEQLVQAVLGPAAPVETVARIVEQAGGHALFLEELIRAVAEGAEELPETVLITLQARFRRFEPRTRRVLAAASVFGETFWRGGLLALLGLEGQGQGPCQAMASQGLDPSLELLVTSETIVQRQESRLAGEVEYAFRHALVREAAYGLLTEEDRRAGHRAVGQYLERAGERAPVVLAEHYQRGGELERAAHFFVHAALEALGGSDLPGALRYVEQGFACGAMGEVLGTLLATGAWARIWTWNFTAGYEMARAALPLLEAGSAAWCRAIGAVVGIASPLGQREAMEVHARILARGRAPSRDRRGLPRAAVHGHRRHHARRADPRVRGAARADARGRRAARGQRDASPRHGAGGRCAVWPGGHRGPLALLRGFEGGHGLLRGRGGSAI